jgi:hypothetical protein
VPHETNPERTARILNSVLFGTVAWAVLAVVLGIALMIYLAG